MVVIVGTLGDSWIALMSSEFSPVLMGRRYQSDHNIILYSCRFPFPSHHSQVKVLRNGEWTIVDSEVRMKKVVDTNTYVWIYDGALVAPLIAFNADNVWIWFLNRN